MHTPDPIEALRYNSKFRVLSDTVTDSNGSKQQIPVVLVKRIPLIIFILSFAILFASVFIFKQLDDLLPKIIILMTGLAGISFTIFGKWGGWLRIYPDKVEVRYGFRMGKYKTYPRYQSSTNLVYSYSQSDKNHRNTTEYYKLVISSTNELGTTLAYNLTATSGSDLMAAINPIFKSSDEDMNNQTHPNTADTTERWSEFD